MERGSNAMYWSARHCGASAHPIQPHRDVSLRLREALSEFLFATGGMVPCSVIRDSCRHS